MNGFPVTVRLLDPPLHEFVPHDEKYFADAWVHPSDEGYRLYADALINAVKATGEKL